jgi:hypothetical protein
LEVPNATLPKYATVELLLSVKVVKQLRGVLASGLAHSVARWLAIVEVKLPIPASFVPKEAESS